MKNLYFIVILFLSMSIYAQNTIQKTTYGGRINVGGGVQADGSDGLELSFTANGNFQIRYKTFYQIFAAQALNINSSFPTAPSNVHAIVFGYLDTAATANPRGAFRSSSNFGPTNGGSNLGSFSPTSFDVFKDPADLTGNTSIFEANYNLIMNGITYQYKLQYVYTYPEKNFSMRHTVTIPSNNPPERRIRIGHGWDTYLNGNDSGPGLAIETPTYLSAQVKRGDVFQGIIHEAGIKWNGYYSAEYNQLGVYLGTDQGTFLAYDSKRINTTSVDNGLGYSVDFGNLPGTYTSSSILSFQCNAPATAPVLTPTGGTVLSCEETTRNIAYNGTMPYVDEDNDGVNDIKVKYFNTLTNEEIFPSENGELLVPEGTYGASFFDSINLCQSNYSTVTIVKYKNCNVDTNDNDEDGVANYLDMDLDNDGILNGIESPNCFYSATEVNVIQQITSTVNGSTPQTSAGNLLASLHNGSTTDSPAFNFATGQTILSGRILFSIDYPGAFVMRTMTVTQAANGIAAGTQYGQLFGSNDGANFVSISAGVLLNATTVTFTSNTTTPYRYYQIRYVGTTAAGNSTSTVTGTAAIQEIRSTVSTTVPYVSSLNLKPGPCSDDTDGDGIPNYLDLDSDNDGCSDAIEGAADLTTSNLVTAPASLSAGEGSAVRENLCATGNCVNQNGIPTLVAQGQALGTSQNALLGCFCYKPPVTTSTTVLDTGVGISSLNRKPSDTSDSWPMARKGAWLAIESKNKGFVINRIPTTAQVLAIQNPVEGMIVYDEQSQCMKIYTTTNNVNYSWQCFDTQTCPD
ncbi:hypothetical protein [Chishuiella changwenlii]|uniref:hypothetical protein n=1 Tax=Chishuiella changwenlii TaxID=1434701 RepID=UPI002FDB081C